MADVEIVRGLFYEAEIVTLLGPFNGGKTPLLRDLAFCIATGTPWCGRPTTQRPVVLLAHESTERKLRPDWERLAAYKKVPVPREPDQFELFLEAGSLEVAQNLEIIGVVAKTLKERLDWFAAKVKSRPTAVFMIDPFDMFFRVDRNKAQHILEIYHRCRMLRRDAPQATFVFSFNMRKRPRGPHVVMPSLLEDPHGWLEEASGALEIQSRSDVRLGLSYYSRPEEGIRVFNGVRREEAMDPMFLRSIVIGEDERGRPMMAGFERISPTEIPRDEVLSPKMSELWDRLEDTFEMNDVIEVAPSRATAYRFRDRCMALGLLSHVGTTFRKVV